MTETGKRSGLCDDTSDGAAGTGMDSILSNLPKLRPHAEPVRWRSLLAPVRRIGK